MWPNTRQFPAPRAFGRRLAAVALLGASLTALSVDAGTLVTQIKDKNGAPVPNAVVYAIPVGGVVPPAAASATAPNWEKSVC